MSAVLPLIILSGPSGSGKSTVLARIVAKGDLPVRVSVSATTRSPRPGERDGVDYHFWTNEKFAEEVKRGAFLEWAQVHGSCYGTLKSEVEPYRHAGRLVVLDIDVQGAAQVRRLCNDSVTIFLKTSTLEAYEERLHRRGTEDEEAIQRRLAAARRELACADQYEYQVVNDDLAAAVTQFRDLLHQILENSSHAG